MEDVTKVVNMLQLIHAENMSILKLMGAIVPRAYQDYYDKALKSYSKIMDAVIKDDFDALKKMQEEEDV